MNLKNMGNEAQDVFSLGRQSSIYSLTFDEFQNTMSTSTGKDFGSMNMDEFLKSIWTAEETQDVIGAATNNPQRQESITLPPMLSQKTVDDVWKDATKEYMGEGSNIPPRQLTLGEVTLEEFLAKAGVVKDEMKIEKTQNFDLLRNLSRSINNQNPGFGFQQFDNQVIGSNTQPGLMGNGVLETNFQSGLVGNHVYESNNKSALHPNSLTLTVSGARHQQPQQIFPKPTQAYANPISNGNMGIANPMMNGNLVQKGEISTIGLGANGVTVSNGCQIISSDGFGRINGDSPSFSPVPYPFPGGLRGRKSNQVVEKVIERRHRRMIKNRESAARSRARKQAYTMELEAEIAKLKEDNQELQRNQAKIREMQKNKVMHMNIDEGGKTQRLKRTHTGPW